MPAMYSLLFVQGVGRDEDVEPFGVMAGMIESQEPDYRIILTSDFLLSTSTFLIASS